jgi:hypothetical protein
VGTEAGLICHYVIRANTRKKELRELKENKNQRIWKVRKFRDVVFQNIFLLIFYLNNFGVVFDCQMNTVTSVFWFTEPAIP